MSVLAREATSAPSIKPAIHDGALWLPESAILLRTIVGVSWRTDSSDPDRRFVVRVQAESWTVDGPRFALIADAMEWCRAVMEAVSSRASASAVALAQLGRAR